ncbi:LOW QUALITY PROTEIN: hypothetical protein V1477_021167 [Vespula maculifrons]|uniref:Uncharacterized protein n=1 Tax=Vespula maculifrons TaxID=7453 RepID=A0ABD2AJN0_VESMC
MLPSNFPFWLLSIASRTWYRRSYYGRSCNRKCFGFKFLTMYLQEGLKKFRKTLTILDSTISSTDNMADELLQKPQNVKAPLGTSHADQFAYHMIFIKKKRNRKKVKAIPIGNIYCEKSEFTNI